jgi:RNA polymerase sigma-70 factor (ECF subfamily)
VQDGPRQTGDPTPLSDEEILTRLRGGETRHESTDLFAELVRRYERELYGYLRRYLGRDDLAADVFQNTFLAVFRKIHHYQPGRSARPWLYTVATNQAIDATRRRNRRADHRGDLPLSGAGGGANGAAGGHDEAGRPLLEILSDPGPGPVAAAELAELRGQVRDAVDQLPALLRQVVVLSYFQGLRYQEIAEALDIPLGTVKSRLHAAVARLCEAWPGARPDGEPDEPDGGE